MIVERTLYYPKPGHWRELSELMEAERQRYPGPHAAHRIYFRRVGSSGPIAMEIEFESFEEREKFLTDWMADPGTAVFREKFYELAERYWTNEIWELVE